MPQKPTQKNKKPRWVKIFLTAIMGMLLLMIVGVAVLLAYPKLLTPLISDYFERRGIIVKIDQLSASWNDGYQLDGLADLNSVFLPVSAKQIDFSTTMDVFSLLSGDFVEHLSINDARITVPYDVSQITKVFQQLGEYVKNNQGTKVNHRLFKMLPKQWDFSAKVLPEQAKDTDKDTINIHAKGKKDQLHQLEIENLATGKLKIVHEISNNTYDIVSESLDLEYFLGKPIYLSRLRATIFEKNTLYSTGFAEMLYEGVKGEISLVGRGDELKIDVRSGGKRVGLSVEQFDKQSYTLNFERFDLSFFQILKPIINVTLISLDSSEIINQMNALKLSGYLSGQLKLNRNNQIQNALFNAEELAINYKGKEVTGITGRLDWNEGLFYYALSLKNSIVTFSPLFSEPVPVNKGWLAGTIDLPSKKLTFSEISLENASIEKLLTQGYWNWKKQTIDVSIQANNVAITKLNDYLSSVVSDGVERYFKQAFIKGNNNQTKVVIKGEYPQLLSREDSVFKVDTVLKNSVFRFYKNKIPDIQVNKAFIALDKRNLTIKIDEGVILNTKQKPTKGVLFKGDIGITDLLSPLLNIDVQLDPTSSEKLLPIAKKSLAKPYIKKFESAVNLDKTMIQTQLNIAIDLKKKKKPIFDIQLNLTKGQQVALNLLPKFKLSRFESEVFIDEKGLKRLKLKGLADKEPTTLTLNQVKSGYQFNAELTSSLFILLSKSELLDNKKLKLIQQQKLVEGQSNFTVNGFLSQRMKLNQLNIKSDLVGTKLDLWDVITKNSQQRLPLSIQYEVKKSKHLMVKLGKNNQLISTLNHQNNLSKASLLIGDQPLKNSTQPFHLTLVSAKARLNDFFDFAKQWKATLKGKNSLDYYNFSTYVNIDKAQIGKVSKEVKSNYFPLKIKGNLKQLFITSPLITGMIDYQPNQFNANLNLLDAYRLFHLFKKEEFNIAGRKVNKLSLAKRLPVMNVQSQSIIWKDRVIGSLDLITSLNNKLYALNHLFLEGNHFYIEASGKEVIEKKGVTTRLAIDIKSENIKDIVKSFQLNDVVDGRFVDISFNLSWLGHAHLLNLDKSKGEATLKAQNLKFTNIKTGAGSVLGFIDVVGTLNRILLDFKNINTSKLAFDSVDGRWKIDQGIAFAESVKATGSLVDLEIKGTVNLDSRQFNHLKIDIIPKASNIIPIVGAVGAGPIGAAIGFVVQKVVGGQINKVAKYTYYLKGDWANPELTKF